MRISIKKKTIVAIGVILVFSGIFALSYNYFIMKKSKVYDIISLAMSELPSNIEESENYPISTSAISDDINEDDDPSPQEEVPKEIITPEKYYVGKLEIPSINLSRGFTSINSSYNSVDKNIAVIKKSNYPDVDKGNFILAGHSGSSWRGFFTNLYKLKKGSVAYVYYNNKKYTYKLKNSYDEKKDGSVSIYRDYNKTTMTLITCTRGSNTKQTIYIFELTKKEKY